jgi:hypothetical protein
MKKAKVYLILSQRKLIYMLAATQKLNENDIGVL